MADFVSTITQTKALDSKKWISDVENDRYGIVLHHTASSADPYSVIDFWNSQPSAVSTPFLIAGKANSTKKWKDGEIIQMYPSNRKHWHLGVKAVAIPRGGVGATRMNFGTVGVEVLNWGGLTLSSKGWKTYAGNIIPESELVELNFRGYKAYQEYTDAQLDSTYKLVKFLGEKYDIPVKFKGLQIFEYPCRDMFMGVKGIYTHCSCRKNGDKQDIAPTPKMLAMLNSL